MNKYFLNNYELMVNYRELKYGMDPELWARLSFIEKQEYNGFINDERRIEWCESRRCLYDIYDSCEQGNQLTTSLSHSWWNNLGMATAVVILDAESKVGIDIENKHRTISQVLSHVVLSGIEPLLDLETLSIWNIKEACYKASRAENKTENFMNYQINSYDENSQIGIVKEVTSSQQFAFKLVEFSDWKIAIAVTLDY